MSDIKTNEVTDKKSLVDGIMNQPFRVPFVDLVESENEYSIIADMPGVNKDNIELRLEDDFLTIIGKVDLEKLQKVKYIIREKRVGNFIRKFKMADTVDVEKINAKFENGQLNVSLPKKESHKPRTIEIA